VNRLAIMAAGAVVLVVAGVGYTLLLEILGPAVTPSPSRTLLPRGTFVAGYAVDIKAVGRGSSVEGRMIVSEGRPSFTVDLQCTRTTEDGVILIGGLTTETTTVVAPEGTYAGIVFMPGSPVRATIWSQRGGDTTQARFPSCLAYLDEKLTWRFDLIEIGPIKGTVELGPNATPRLTPGPGSAAPP
jgi:hypothetical protein